MKKPPMRPGSWDWARKFVSTFSEIDLALDAGLCLFSRTAYRKRGPGRPRKLDADDPGVREIVMEPRVVRRKTGRQWTRLPPEKPPWCRLRPGFVHKTYPGVRHH
jgi:hypothetical protein